MTELWTTAKAFNSRGTLNEPTIPIDTFDAVVKRIAPDFVPNLPIFPNFLDEDSPNNFLGAPITFEVLHAVLASVGNTAAEPDGVKYDMIKHLSNEAKLTLLGNLMI